MRWALLQSLFFHFFLIALFVACGWIFKVTPKYNQKFRVEIKEALVLEEKKSTEPPVVQTRPVATPVPAKPTKKVFGLSRNSLQSEKSGAVEVKQGNTLAKEIDQDKLSPGDEDSLPIPAEEYLVTQMPRLQSEVRIPYPAQAKAKNIEGAVIMEILIDENGKVRQAQLIDGPGYGLNEAALKAIYDFRFSPAVIEKKPVAVRIRYAYRFILN